MPDNRQAHLLNSKNTHTLRMDGHAFCMVKRLALLIVDGHTWMIDDSTA